MAWALRFDEPWGKYLSTPVSHDFSSSNTITIRYKYTCVGGRANNELIYLRDSLGKGTYIRIGNTTTPQTLTVGIAGAGARGSTSSYTDGDTLDVVAIIDLVTNLLVVNINGIEEINDTLAAINNLKNAGSFVEVRFGNDFGTRYMLGDFYLAEYHQDGAALNNWDATASDHSGSTDQPDLVDTVGGNDATGVGFPSFDASVWVDLGGGGVEQEIIIPQTEQINQSELIAVSSINAINAIVCESLSHTQLAGIQTFNLASAITTEQKTEYSLSAIATIQQATTVISEQLTQSALVDNETTQLIYVVQAEQFTESITVDISGVGAQDINVVVTEQKAQVQALTIDEIASIQTVIAEQISQAIISKVSTNNAITSITTEQLAEAIIVDVDEFSGVFVSVVQTEQITEAQANNIDVVSIINSIVSEQLAQVTAQHINVDINVDAIISEQLTQAELIAIIESNIATSLNIDIDQISIEMLTPTYSIEMLTPTYTIEHIH